ncbi:MAG TPA: metallophosphoesterase [Acidimicrobiales bacterium]|nr:metallophosphoesterase [Acidimicrobiales bacterium]
MVRFLTADLHLGHARICEYTGRPFTSVEEMNDWLIDAWNERVRPGDEVFVLGDVVLGRVTETLPLVSELQGTLHLVVGNHDRPFEAGPRRPEWQARYRAAGFRSITYGSRELDLGLESPVLACHFPYEGDSLGEERFEELRPADLGQRLVHGHLHGQYRRRGRMVDVGVDAWAGRPVAFEEVAALFLADEEAVAPLPWRREA